ncbi:hypothetical protein FUAX_22690 [Fulvitalea axinellae]|uniref:Lipoprotein n=1 Tax=Fulvitalea axinellae TaxID=1182444 RepID=A0AAU9CPE6_9BACT|nr:hypothetical protein FUAX_22690 [Fulvitalea axinellae]
MNSFRVLFLSAAVLALALFESCGNNSYSLKDLQLPNIPEGEVDQQSEAQAEIVLQTVQEIQGLMMMGQQGAMNTGGAVARSAATEFDISMCETMKSLSEAFTGTCPAIKFECDDSKPNDIIILYDFGDGCEQMGKTYAGKMRFSVSMGGTSAGMGTFEFIDFKADGKTINGTATQSVEIGDGSFGSAKYVTEGQYEVETAKDTYNLKYKVKTSMDFVNLEFVLDNTVEGSAKSGFSFKSVTVEPIKASLSCGTAFEAVCVKGKEKVTVTVNKKDSAFTVDYGDGECDYLYTITGPSGTVKKYDLRTGNPLIE